jgi:succinate-acetate transporter protein
MTMANDDDRSDLNVEDYENIWLRLVHMVIIAVLMSMASTLLGVMTVAQFLIMLMNNRRPNDQLAEMGTTMGVWMAKAARYQTAASEVKPWPWTELD